MSGSVAVSQATGGSNCRGSESENCLSGTPLGQEKDGRQGRSEELKGASLIKQEERAINTKQRQMTAYDAAKGDTDYSALH